MAGYIQSNLSKGEEIVKRANVSFFLYTKEIILAIILLVGGFVYRDTGLGIFIPIGLFFLIYPIIVIKTSEIAFTNKRIMAKFGVIRRQTFELKLEKIESVNFTQGILGRMFNFGYIIVNGAGNSTPILGISKPLEFRNFLNEYLDENINKDK